MPEPTTDVKPPVAPSTTVPPVPASQAQPAPAAVPPAGVPSKPDVKPDSMVPLPALQEERSKRQALEAEVAELKRMIQPSYQQPQPIASPVAPQYDSQAELEKLWESDPRKAVEATIMMSMEYRDKIDASLEVQADTLSQRYPDFNNYRSVALGHVRSLPLHQRAGQGILEAAYWMVRGQRFDSVLQQREQEIIERYRRGELAAGLGMPPGSFSAPMPSQTITLSEDQRRAAEAMGMTPESYAANIKLRPGA